MGYIILLALYFIPTIIAVTRKHKDMPAIAAVNILLGWTVFGWFVPLIWALADPSGRGGSQTIIVNAAQHNAAPAPASDSGQMLASQASPTVDADAAYWDRISDKNDADQLEEYLIRFPEGAFAQLARKKLERQGVTLSVANDLPDGLPSPG